LITYQKDSWYHQERAAEDKVQDVAGWLVPEGMQL
jgi:hypothetical protein